MSERLQKKSRPEGRLLYATGGEDLSGFPLGRDPRLGVAMSLQRPLRLEGKLLQRRDSHAAGHDLALDCEQERCARGTFALGVDLDAAGDVMLHLEPPYMGNPDVWRLTT